MGMANHPKGPYVYKCFSELFYLKFDLKVRIVSQAVFCVFIDQFIDQTHTHTHTLY